MAIWTSGALPVVEKNPIIMLSPFPTMLINMSHVHATLNADLKDINANFHFQECNHIHSFDIFKPSECLHMNVVSNIAYFLFFLMIMKIVHNLKKVIRIES